MNPYLQAFFIVVAVIATGFTLSVFITPDKKIRTPYGYIYDERATAEARGHVALWTISALAFVLGVFFLLSSPTKYDIAEAQRTIDEYQYIIDQEQFTNNQ